MKPKINWIRIQKIAYKLREDLGIEEPSDLLLMDVAEYLGIEVEISDLVNYEAYLMRYGNEGIIRLKAGSNPNRQRFSLAHEIGHWLLHPRLTQKFSVASDMVDLMCTGKSGHEILLNGESKHGKKTQYRVQK